MKKEGFFSLWPGRGDHPFLRVHTGMARLSLDDGTSKAVRTTEDQDMAYFERQYQARVNTQLVLCLCTPQ